MDIQGFSHSATRGLGIVALILLGSTSAYAGKVGSIYKVHNEVWGWCVTRTYKVHTASTFGHNPGHCWTLARLIKVVVEDHSVNATAVAVNDDGLSGGNVLAAYDLATFPGQVLVDIHPHSLIIPQGAFDDPNNILSGNVVIEIPQGSAFQVPDIRCSVEPFFGMEPEFNFDGGSGLETSNTDISYNPQTDGTSIVPSEGIDYYTEIDSNQVVPPSNSPGRGSAAISIDTTTNTLCYVITFDGIVANETVSHIHGAAPPGMNAGVLHGVPLGSPKVGTWNYAQSQEAIILGALTYINIHSAAFPAGEIRGQISPRPVSYCGSLEINCPCNNAGDMGEGCRNSTNQGAVLSFAGLPSVTLDTLTLTMTQMPPNQFGIIYDGNAALQLPFGDGVRCVGGTSVNRFPVQNSGPSGSIGIGPGIVAFSQANFPVSGHILAGGTWNFQGWYRDPFGPCNGFFNLSSGISATFTP